MKPKSLLTVLTLLVTASLLLAACSASGPDDPQFPTGKFVDASDQYVGYTFKDGKTWQYFTYGEIGAEGTFKVKGSQWINNGDEECPFPATYEWSFDGTNLTFKLVGEDQCDPRRESTDGKTFVLTN